METLYETENISTRYDFKTQIIHWTPQKIVPLTEWESSLLVGLDKTKEIKNCSWLNDLRDFNCFEKDQIAFVNKVINKACDKAPFPSNVAFVESCHHWGNLAIKSYIAHTNFLYPKISIQVFKEPYNAEQWLLTRQLICV